MTSTISTKPLLVIVPAFNEQESISQVVSDIRAEQLDVLVVDDGSSDETAVRAETAGASVLSLPINLGVGGALRAGFRFAVDNNYAAVVQVDADGQHPVNQIRDLVAAAEKFNAHLVIGSRYLSSDSSLIPSAPRRLAMRILSWVILQAAGLLITDSTSGFRIICKPLLIEFAREFPAHYLGDTFEATIGAVRARFSVIEIPASLSPRQLGEPSSGKWKSVMLTARALIVSVLKLSPQPTCFNSY